MFKHTSTTEGNGVPLTIRASPSTFVRCEFTDHATAEGTPVIYAEAGAPVWVQESEFENNTAETELAARGGAQFFSDDQTLSVDTADGPDAPQPLSSADATVKRLAWEEDWIKAVEPVRAAPAMRSRCRNACTDIPTVAEGGS